ncbi:gluconolactonase [Pseudoalteromonas piscicida]|uniref:Gluconolactonase n=1 Tax=Pseudoalteromonas piscicida TaxID=43662 RepID=A0AAQ2IQA4_PSEO7|nr:MULTISPECIES: SMP-30/gluconolactonase/LRE family protein [Pseudoalteromonas]KJY90212.1 gluconolactonase [Pseudoalteromonas piscicida]TMN37794.1 gluconolactonase [Pseudoalteromonas piscicida]TMN41492.1 gluconolactonase [Pseudoalteromonas piscicida]TMN47485.1 gluconolactonase [Pseudoalteromonas piscicida]TMN54030.1 gluconolactonase [Pseudoalteromonas piscicida]
MRKVILSLFLLQSSGYVAANTVVDTQDWITDGVFTQGIEGPAVDDAGVLYAVNHQQQGTIGKVTAQGKAETLLTLKNGSIGNGIRFDKQGNMYIADYVNHNVLKVTKAALAQGGDLSQSVTVFAHDNRMDQPNDLAIMDNGILFASDPNWQASSGNLWRINTSGEVTLLEADMGTTNGIEVSPDNKTLYVNESVQRKVWRYELDEQGNISNKQLFISFTDFGLDGMRTDNQGNLYIARYGAGVVAVVSPQGKLIKEIKLKGKYPTNVAFGGEAGKRLFITLQKRGAIEMAEVEFAGREK